MAFFNRIRKIHTWQVFFSLAAVLVVFSFFDKGSALDIHLHDTYIVLAHSHVILALAFLSGFFGLLYYALRGWLPFKLLSWMHVLLTSLPILLTYLHLQYPGFAGKPRRYYDYSAWKSFTSFGMLNTFISVVVVACFLAQGLFLLNLIIGILFKITRRT